MTESTMVSKRIDVTLQADVLKRLDHLAKENGLSRSAMLAVLINDATA